jgi:hypothetical protein
LVWITPDRCLARLAFFLHRSGATPFRGVRMRYLLFVLVLGCGETVLPFGGEEPWSIGGAGTGGATAPTGGVGSGGGGVATGGSGTGGATGTGGAVISTGGAASGGAQAATGGVPGTGGAANGGAASGGAPSTGGAPATSTGGASTGGASGTGGAPSMARPCEGFCSPPVTVPPGMNSGALGTGRGCYEVIGTITAVVCGNFIAPRTLYNSGIPLNCNSSATPAAGTQRNGGYCFTAPEGAGPDAYFTTY